MTYPEPHDLAGHAIPNRAGDPLLVGDAALVDMLVAVAYNAWRQMGHTANAAPCAQALSDRILHPRPGDPVYVPDSLRRWSSPDDRRKGVGYLIVERDELGAGGQGEPVFYVQYGPEPGDVCRWQNATVQAIPYGDDMMREINEAASEIVRRRDAQ